MFPLSIKNLVYVFIVSLLIIAQVQASKLMDAQDDFHTKNWQSAADKFYALRKMGGIIPCKYLEYMKTNQDFIKEHGIVVINDDYNDDYDPIPERGLKLSSDYLNASLDFLKYQYSKNNKQQVTAENDLCTKACNGNTHAITLLDKILNKNPNAFANSKKFKQVKDISYFNKYISLKDDDLFPFWGIIDPSRLYWAIDEGTRKKGKDSKEFFQSLRVFKTNLEKHPTETMMIIEGMAKHKLYSTQPLWLHLAFENGLTFVCPGLFKCLWDKRGDKFEGKSVKALGPCELEDISFACYYASKIKPSDKIEKEKLSGILGRQSQIYTLLATGEKESQRLRKYYDIWAETSGTKEEQYDFAQVMRMGQGGPVNLEGAYRFYEMSASQGYAMAQYDLAVMLYSGLGVEQNLIKAYTLMREAAKTLSRGKGGLARMLYRGKGCDQNVPLAIIFAQRAADEGEVASQFDVAAMLYNHGGDTPTILKYFKMAADRGDAYAQYAYARTLLETEADQNRKEALRYLRMSAAASHTNAIILLHKQEQKLAHQKAAALQKTMTNVSQITQSLAHKEFESITILEEENKEQPVTPSPPLDEVVEEKIETEKPLISQQIALDDTAQKDLEEDVKEYERYVQEEAVKHAEMRKKKLEQKQARVTLKFKKADDFKKELKISSALSFEKTKFKVSQETLDFVKIVFGDGDNKFTNYTNEGSKGAKGFFQNLGCVVQQKKNENSTVVYFDLGEDRIAKLKYHNPHPDDSLYFAMKRHMKRYLECIHRSPEALTAK